LIRRCSTVSTCTRRSSGPTLGAAFLVSLTDAIEFYLQP
jgi:hypothetical protein